MKNIPLSATGEPEEDDDDDERVRDLLTGSLSEHCPFPFSAAAILQDDIEYIRGYKDL